MGQNQYMRRLIAVALWLGITISVFWLLKVGRPFLLPLILAILAVYLTDILSTFCKRIPGVGDKVPAWTANVLSYLVIFGLAWLMFSIVVDNASKISAVAPKYQESMLEVYKNTLSRFNIDEPDSLDDLFEKLNFKSVVGEVAAGMTSLVSDAALVFLYFFFLLLEKSFIPIKLRLLFPNDQKRQSFMKIWRRIDQDIRIYLGVKVFVSLLVSLGSYIVLKIVGVDFSEFWALLIFAFNFIPNIGSFIATLLPTLLAIVQFGGFQEALTVLIGITALQVVIGNVLEPQLTGSRLNLSPFIALVFLVFWGMIWGIAGMLLCVPIAVMMMIIFSHFESTRWVAILLSKNGEIVEEDPEEEVTPSDHPAAP